MTQEKSKTKQLHYEVEDIVLPRIVSIKEAGELMHLPIHYIRRLCREVPEIAFRSGNKWYVNLGKLSDYYNNQLK